MPDDQHHDVRTTLTLDDDVAAKLKSRSRITGQPFREVVNDALRRGLEDVASRKMTRAPFVVDARDLGELAPGLNLAARRWNPLKR